MGIVLHLYFLFLLTTQTTLVDPPGQLSLYSHISMKMAEVLLGKHLDIGKVGYIDCVKLNNLPTGANKKDYKYVLTIYGVDEGKHRIVYNKGLMGIETYGRKGSGKGEFFHPRGITADRNGNIFVVDMFNYRVVHLYNTGDSIEWHGSFGEFGCGEGEFDRPSDISMDANHRLYITDMFNNRVVICDTAGNFIRTVDSLIKPDAIEAISYKNLVYPRDSFFVVIDMLHTRISKYSLSGKLLARVTDYDMDIKNAYFSDIDIDRYGNIYVVDRNNCVIHKFDRNLNLIVSFGGKGTGKGEFIDPVSLSIYRPFGWFYIVESKGLSYYWAGVDGEILSFTPDTLKKDDAGITISLYITSQSKIRINILDEKGDTIRKLLPVVKRKTGRVFIIWDGLDDNGKRPLPGKYEVNISLQPLYSSRRYFKKYLKGYIYVQ